ncbi:MAG: site-specific DNA-methyltransferase [Candidatus Scalindua sediminis]|nr:site-specific DNA-methyltransferase [Candidatus Scalindua sediminis]
MAKLPKKDLKRIIEILNSGEELPVDYKHILFPPEKKEYELVYAKKEREEDIIANAMAVPLQPIKTFGKNGNDWTNKLVFGDNLQVMKSLLDDPDVKGQVKLVYIDPPFATKQEFRGSQDQKAYQDKIAGARFIEYLRKRLLLFRELLSKGGSLFVHLDLKRSHYMKVMMDEIFGERIENEIIWHYPDNFQGNVNRFPNNHNVIYFYSMSDATRIKRVEIPLNKKTKRDVRIWDKESQSLVAARDEDGKIIYKEFTHKFADDVWVIGQSSVTKKKSSEFIDYPTQKPEELLRRVIECSTEKGDLVLDFFLGSGTTASVCLKLNRKCIGIEQLEGGMNTALPRLCDVVKGKDNKGISKVVKWQGGGEFIYCELKKYNEAFMDKIQAAKTSNNLVKVWKDIAKNSFLNWYVNPEMPEEAINDIIEIGKTENGLEKQKKLLAELLNKNQLYVNLSEIDDKDFNVSEEDKKLNKSFYGEAYNG